MLDRYPNQGERPAQHEEEGHRSERWRGQAYVAAPAPQSAQNHQAVGIGCEGGEPAPQGKLLWLRRVLARSLADWHEESPKRRCGMRAVAVGARLSGPVQYDLAAGE